MPNNAIEICIQQPMRKRIWLQFISVKSLRIIIHFDFVTWMTILPFNLSFFNIHVAVFLYVAGRARNKMLFNRTLPGPSNLNEV